MLGKSYKNESRGGNYGHLFPFASSAGSRASWEAGMAGSGGWAAGGGGVASSFVTLNVGRTFASSAVFLVVKNCAEASGKPINSAIKCP
jgi:hypothetical protein